LVTELLDPLVHTVTSPTPKGNICYFSSVFGHRTFFIKHFMALVFHGASSGKYCAVKYILGDQGSNCPGTIELFRNVIIKSATLPRYIYKIRPYLWILKKKAVNVCRKCRCTSNRVTNEEILPDKRRQSSKAKDNPGKGMKKQVWG
jgi:hypothetical protein